MWDAALSDLGICFCRDHRVSRAFSQCIPCLINPHQRCRYNGSPFARNMISILQGPEMGSRAGLCSPKRQKSLQLDKYASKKCILRGNFDIRAARSLWDQSRAQNDPKKRAKRPKKQPKRPKKQPKRPEKRTKKETEQANLPLPPTNRRSHQNCPQMSQNWGPKGRRWCPFLAGVFHSSFAKASETDCSQQESSSSIAPLGALFLLC